MSGARCIAAEPLEPRGYVRVGAELWRARLADSQAMVACGSSLRVCEVRGMTLVVEPAAEEDDGVASPHGSLADP